MFLDDERLPPNDGQDWVIVRSSQQAIQAVLERGVPSFISYDHDLGGDDTAMRFIAWMIDSYLDGDLTIFPVDYTVHSQNPVGAKNIRDLLAGFIACEITPTR